MTVFSPPIRNSVSFRPSGSVRKQGSLITLDENVTDIVENPDSYTVSISDEMGESERDISKDWVDSVDLTNDIISFYPPSGPINEYEIDVKSKSVESEFDSGIAKTIKFQFTVKPNLLTHILNEDRLSDFRTNYYFKDREITKGEFDELKNELDELVIKDKGRGKGRVKNRDNRKIRCRKRKRKGKNDRVWVEEKESAKIEIETVLERESRSFAQGQFETGNFSILWSVSSQTNWESNEYSSDGTHTSSGSLKLGDWYDGHEDGNLSPWVQEHYLDIHTSPVYSGSYSIGLDTNVSEEYNIGYVEPSEISGGEQITGLEVYWQETSGSTGGGVRLKDSSGNWVFGFGTWNPQWFVDDSGNGDFYEVYDGGGNYNDWIYFKFDFDWTNNKYDYYMKNMNTGHTESGTRSLTGSTADIERIEIEYIPNASLGWNEIRNNDMRMWFDDWKILNKLGSWTSTIWDSGVTSKQQIDSFEVNSTVDTSTESVTCRIGVDENDDGTIDTWSHTSGNGVDVTGGTQTFSSSDFNLPSGYRYQIEFNPLEVTDGNTTHGPSVQDYTLMVSTAALPITIDGEQVKSITIDGNTVKGLTIDGTTIF